jgi:hypothetical protein
VETLKPGVLRWTSPRGFTYDVTPEPVTEPEPPPPF